MGGVGEAGEEAGEFLAGASLAFTEVIGVDAIEAEIGPEIWPEGVGDGPEFEEDFSLVEGKEVMDVGVGVEGIILATEESDLGERNGGIEDRAEGIDGGADDAELAPGTFVGGGEVEIGEMSEGLMERGRRGGAIEVDEEMGEAIVEGGDEARELIWEVMREENVGLIQEERGLEVKGAAAGFAEGIGEESEEREESEMGGVEGADFVAELGELGGGDEERIGVNAGERMGVSEIGQFLERRKRGKEIFFDEEEDILGVPAFDEGVLPDGIAEEIDGDKVMGGEESGPIIGPLFVEMVGTALVGDGGGEEDDWGERGEESDEVGGGGWREMFGDFEGEGEIVGEGPRWRGREIGGVERSGIDFEGGAVDIIAIETGDGDGGETLEDAEPGARAAADIGDRGAGGEVGEEEGSDDFGGGAGACADIIKESGGVGGWGWRSGVHGKAEKDHFGWRKMAP